MLGRPRRERPGSLSFAISLWNDKEMASKPAQRTRAKHSVSVKGQEKKPQKI